MQQVGGGGGGGGCTCYVYFAKMPNIFYTMVVAVGGREGGVLDVGMGLEKTPCSGGGGGGGGGSIFVSSLFILISYYVVLTFYLVLSYSYFQKIIFYSLLGW